MRGHGADVRRPQRPRALRTSEGKVGGLFTAAFWSALDHAVADLASVPRHRHPVRHHTAAPVDVVTQVGFGTRQVLSGGRTRLVFDLRYERSGRFSFFLQRPRASRISIIRGSRIGDRVLRKAFFAPVVQQGQAGTTVWRPLIVKGMPEAGSVMRAIVSQADGSLDGAQFPLAPNTPVSEMGL